MDQLLSVEEAARFLRVSEIHLRKLLNEGTIPYINVAHGKIRKSIRIEKKSIDEFISKGGIQDGSI